MFWGWLDLWCHRLHLPVWVVRPVCDRYELWLGVTPEELH